MNPSPINPKKTTTMSIAPQNLLLNPRSNHLCFYSNHTPRTSPLKPPIFTLSISPKNGVVYPPLHYGILNHRVSIRDLNSLRWPLRVFESEGEIQREGFDKFNFDAFLSVAEVLCLTPSAVFSIGCVVNWAFSTSKNSFQVSIGNRVFIWQFVMLVGAVFVGGLIRRRQWRRICRDSKKSSVPSFNLIERIEKVEEDLRSSATIIKVLSRQLEKLGIRFRVTRKAMKEPIAETAALAQKNSEATRALAAHEDILEKELGEIQKVLLAMQEQQQKQLELILAVIKAGKERKSKQEPVAEPELSQKSVSVSDNNKPTKEMQTQIQTGDRHDGRA